MVATSHPLAAQIGLDVLKAGGNAVDAAIAVNAALGLVEPMCCGIGGDLYAIVWDAKTGQLHGLNASGRAPHTATRDFFAAQAGQGIPDTRPALLVGARLRRWLGHTAPPLRQCPGQSSSSRASATPRTAFPSPRSSPATGAAPRPSSRRSPDAARTYLSGGQAPRAGAVFKNPLLARTYRDDRRRGPGRVLQGPDRPGDRRVLRARTAVCSAEGFRRPHHDLGRAGQDQLSRLRRLGAATARPGHRGLADAQHPRRL